MKEAFISILIIALNVLIYFKVLKRLEKKWLMSILGVIFTLLVLIRIFSDQLMPESFFSAKRLAILVLFSLGIIIMSYISKILLIVRKVDAPEKEFVREPPRELTVLDSHMVTTFMSTFCQMLMIWNQNIIDSIF